MKTNCWIVVGALIGLFLYNNAHAVQCWTQTYLINGQFVSCLVCQQPNGNVTTSCT